MILKMSTKMLNSHDQQLTLGYVVEIRKLRSSDENQDPELEPEPENKEMTKTVSELIERLRLIDIGIKSV
jgi:type IV secretory pathway TrbF-like protein